jgi:hypothetical protein
VASVRASAEEQAAHRLTKLSALHLTHTTAFSGPSEPQLRLCCSKVFIQSCTVKNAGKASHTILLLLLPSS